MWDGTHALVDAIEGRAQVVEHPNATLVRRVAEARLRLDEEALRELLAEDLIFHNVLADDGSRELRGRGAVIAMWRGVAEEGSSVSFDIEDVLANDERAIVVAKLLMRRPSRGALTMSSVWVCRCADGEVAEAWFYYEDQAALSAFWS
jgi:ketosteroid isomerase-like protein